MIFSITLKGNKKVNEDRFFIREYDNGAFLIAVADGMGGAPAGDLASQIAVESLEGFNSDSQSISDDLFKSMNAANSTILEKVAQNQRLTGMGTTMTAVFSRDGLSHWVHIGDSRLYLLREKKIQQITDDHSPTGILMGDGEITKEEARIHPSRNLLFECLGWAGFKADSGTIEIAKGDLLLLATDGLHASLSEEAITAILVSNTDLKENLRSLALAAVNAGGKDDITVVGARI